MKINDHTSGITSQGWCWQTIYAKKRSRKRTYHHWRQCWYINKTTRRLYTKAEAGERLIAATRNNTDDTRTNRTTITIKQDWEEKQLYGWFKWLIMNISHEKIWTWLWKGTLNREMESLLKGVQKHAIGTNHIKRRIDRTQQNSKWRFCGDRDEKINHIKSDWSKLA